MVVEILVFLEKDVATDIKNASEAIRFGKGLLRGDIEGMETFGPVFSKSNNIKMATYRVSNAAETQAGVWNKPISKRVCHANDRLAVC